MDEITLPRADALDVLDALESGMEVCWTVNSLSVLAMMEFAAGSSTAGCSLIYRRR